MIHHIVDWVLKGHDLILLVIGLGALWSVTREVWHRLSHANPHRVTKYGIERTAFHFKNKKTIHIFGLYHEEPTIEVEGRVPLAPKEKEYAAKLPRPRVNDPHAVLVGDTDWSVRRPHLTVQSLDYTEVKALMYAGLAPDEDPRLVPLVSANAIILCPERKQLILHRRAKGIRTYECCLHTIGGGYMPPGVGPKDDLYSLKNTLVREVEEEVRAKLSFDETPPLLFLEELDTGFIHLAFLGINISGAHCDQLHDNPNPFEGKAEKVSFDQLPEYLDRTDWVPAGKAAVLAWLALGAPGTGWLQRFARRTAAELFREATSRTHQYSNVHPITPGSSK